MIAFHFPPMRGSSGILRALKYCQYLPEYGWDPAILTAHARAYATTSPDQMTEIPTQMTVARAFALDVARHLSVRGRYPGWLEIPDRWSPWAIGGVCSGLRLVRRFRPDVIWSTFPIATAHVIGVALHKLTGIPWVADFRDPMAQEGYPSDPRRHRAYRWIEERALRHAARVLFTTPGTLRMYAERYPWVPTQKLAINENGYDEESFRAAEMAALPASPAARPLKLLHSGIVYPSERDPQHLFQAVQRLLKTGQLNPGEVEIVFRASGHDGHLAALIEKHAVGSVVKLAPALGYRDALAEMIQADALLVLQASNCNEQIPAKLYEYFRARRPILALTDPKGDTASALRQAGLDAIAPLDSPAAIAELLPSFLRSLHRRDAAVALPDAVAASSRRARAGELASVLASIDSS
jgi:glycosyltransferase involved in cell wall biosynthesis